MNLKIFVILAVLSAGFECSRILVLYPTISKSHVMPLQTLSMALAERGHNITFVSPYPLGKQLKNYRDIKTPFDEADKEFLNEMTKNPNGQNKLSFMSKLFSLVFRTNNETLQMKEMRKLMDEEEFDLVIVGYFMTDVMLGFADHFKCPSILFSPAGHVSPILQALGNPLGTSSVPHLLLSTEKMNFIGRLKTFVVQTAELGIFRYVKYRSREIYE